MVAFGLQGAFSLLTRVMNPAPAALTVGLDLIAGSLPLAARPQPHTWVFRPSRCGIPGAYCLVHSPTMEQHLLYVAGSSRSFAAAAQRQELKVRVRAPGARLPRTSNLGGRRLAVDPRKVQSILERATSTSCAEVRRFTGSQTKTAASWRATPSWRHS